MDSLTTLFNALEVTLLALTILIAHWALKGFRQSKQALREAASYVSVIVGALSSRIESLEASGIQLQNGLDATNQQNRILEDTQTKLQSNYQTLLKSIQGLLDNDKRLMEDLEQLRSRLSTLQPLKIEEVTERSRMPESNVILDRLTPTESQVLDILVTGPLGAPELGRRLNKSREHMARLMKKLYLEGYVDRESDRPPFRYKLNDKLRSSIGGAVATSPSKP
jgi:chromosome segregation ATPase